MSDLLNIATIVLAGIIQASLQLSLGGLVLLYYSSMGHHKRRKTRYLAKSYIWGASAISFVIVCAGAFVLQNTLGGPIPHGWMMVAVGALIACALVMLLGYFRDGNGTELWLPKSVSRYITRRAKTANDNVEAFSLGMLRRFRRAANYYSYLFYSGQLPSRRQDATCCRPALYSHCRYANDCIKSRH